MGIIDVHAHWVPYEYRRAVAEVGLWHGLDGGPGELDLTGMHMTVEERVADMDALGVDMQMLSPQAGFYQYELPASTTKVIARETNDAIAAIVEQYPTRFCGVGTLPMQQVDIAIEELRRITDSHGLKGAVISDHVAGATYEEPQFDPFWEAVQELGAVIFFHQGINDHRARVGKFHLNNTIGNLAEHTMNYGVMASGGVLDRYPDLKLIFAHGGGYIPFAVARMDKAAGRWPMDTPAAGQYVAPYQALPGYEGSSKYAPSEYLNRFFYDCCVYGPAQLRFLIDQVGIDRIVFGTDSPAPMVLTDGVRWVQSLDVLTDDEKDAILTGNATKLLGL